MNGLLTGDPRLVPPMAGATEFPLSITPAPFGAFEATAVVPVDPLSRPPADTPPPVGQLDARGARFPQVGETFLGFQLAEVLGTGAFAHVYLAHQAELADRPVALKVTTRPSREPQRLARLRHTNVVPIYSVHDRTPLQAVCMPYLGRRTLADVLEEYRERGVFPQTSAHLASTAALVATTQVSTRSTVPADAPIPLQLTAAPVEDTQLPSQVDLVLWVLARLADGLAHAHDRGILHLDLKPANVLLADDGQPLLLDFNLSYDVRSDHRPRAGGTLPYMAPEQLEDYRDGGPSCVDQRTDLFSLGVIAFELLTGRKPFPTGPDKARDLTQMIATRKKGPHRVREFNPAVTPAVEAIVLKLLHPLAEKRYQTANDLAEDLDRHRRDLPLKHAVDRSLAERAAKWRRRNPKAPLVAALAVVALAAVGAGFAAYRHAESRRVLEEDRARAEAVAQADGLRTELEVLRADLTSREHAKNRAAARDAARELLAGYGLPAGLDQGALARLSPEGRAALTDDLGELALLMAHSLWLDGRGKPGDVRGRAFEDALAWNRVAETCFAGRTSPLAVAHQRARLAGEGSAAAGETDIDLYLVGSELIAEGRFADAVKKFEALTSRNPGHYAGHFAVGVCRQEMGDTSRALERYLVAQALVPTDYRAAYNRGVLLYNRKEYEKSEKAFTEAIDRNPSRRRPADLATSLRYRASCRLALRNHAGVIEDLKQALDLGVSQFHIRYQLARAYDESGDKEAAARERAVADTLTPTEMVDYLYRGQGRMNVEPTLARADFEKATELNPNSIGAWQNLAHVLSDRLGDQVKALEAQERAVAAAPEYARAHSGRAVLYARLGRRADAHNGAEHAMLLSTDPWVTYEAVCVYALTAATHPNDWKAAEDLFRQALRAGFRDFKHIDGDRDLKEALKRPAFRDALNAAKLLSK